jgi:hypothetical protein
MSQCASCYLVHTYRCGELHGRAVYVWWGHRNQIAAPSNILKPDSVLMCNVHCSCVHLHYKCSVISLRVKRMLKKSVKYRYVFRLTLRAFVIIIIIIIRTLHVSIKPIIIRCLFIQRLQIQGKSAKFCDISDIYTFYIVCDISQNFALLPRIWSFCINKPPLMIGWIETCSVWDNDDKYRVCQTEYVVLFYTQRDG